MGIENKVFRDLSQEEQEKKKEFINRRGGDQDFGPSGEKIKRRFKRLKETGWGEVWDDKKLWYVAESEQYYSDAYERDNNVKNAEILEELTNYGISELRWLGNFPDKNLGGKVDFRAFSASTREFDDKKHRIDSIATLVLGGRIKKRHSFADNQFEIGVDATTWKKDERMPERVAERDAREYFAEKISRSNNEKYNFQRPLPFGFSQLDFYVNPYRDKETGKNKKGKIESIPRFVIGVNGEIADSIRQYDFRINEKGQYVPKQSRIIDSDPRTITTRFKVLSEINKQAEMMIRMMPEDYAGNEELERARAKLNIMKKITEDALKRSVGHTIEVMFDKKVLPIDVAEEVADKSTAEQVAIMSRLFRDPKRKINAYHYDSTYDGIMSAAESFIEYANSGNDEMGLKKAQARDKAFINEGGVIRELDNHKPVL